VPTDEQPSEPKYIPSKYKKMRVTAYCPCPICCGKFADGITANGHSIKPGDKFVAAPRNFSFGTMLYIDGYSDKPVPVLDRGGAIKGDRIDVFFPTHKEALEWGVKYIDVYFCDEVCENLNKQTSEEYCRAMIIK